MFMHLMAIKATPRQACGTNGKWEEIKTRISHLTHKPDF